MVAPGITPMAPKLPAPYIPPLLTPLEQRFVEQYVITRDPRKAALRVGLKEDDGRSYCRRKYIRAAIERKLAIHDTELAKLTAKANLLVAEQVDAELTKAIKAPMGKGGVASAKVAALKLAYERLGVLRGGELPEAPTPTQGNMVYRALGQTTTVKQTFTTEVTQQTQALAGQVTPTPAREGIVIEGDEVEEY